MAKNCAALNIEEMYIVPFISVDSTECYDILARKQQVIKMGWTCPCKSQCRCTCECQCQCTCLCMSEK